MELFYIFVGLAIGMVIVGTVIQLTVSWIKHDKNEYDISTDYDYEMYLKELEEQEKRNKNDKTN